MVKLESRWRSFPKPQTKQNPRHIPSLTKLPAETCLESASKDRPMQAPSFRPNYCTVNYISWRPCKNPVPLPAKLIWSPACDLLGLSARLKSYGLELVLVFHINYINRTVCDAEVGADIPSQVAHKSINIDHQHLDVWQHLTPETLGSLSDDGTQKWLSLKQFSLI